MLEALQYDFIQRAIIAGVLVSIICGMIGTLVVVNRIVFIAGGITHASYGGIGLSLFLKIPPTIGATIFSLLVSFVIGGVTLKDKQRADTVIGAIWAFGMALGIILIDLTPGYNVDIMSYLFGNILTVSTFDLWVMGILSIFIFIIVSFFYKQFLTIAYDEEYAKVIKIPVNALYMLLLALISVSIIMIIQVVGLILVIALFTIPPYIAEKTSSSLYKMMMISSFLSLIFTLCGLWLSYTKNLSSGASIILVASLFFFMFEVFQYLKKKKFRFQRA